MLHLINTRPKTRAESLLTHDLGLEHFLPLLQLDACPLHEDLSIQLQQCTTCEVIIVVSPSAVEIGFQYAQQLAIDFTTYPIHWIAVGSKTAECLSKYNIIADVPTIETSEGMLQLAIFQEHIQRVAFWRGHGGREWLMYQLQEKNIEILNILLYQRRFPISTQTHWQHLYPQLSIKDDIVVLISSGESWHYWQMMVQHQLDHYSVYYLVLGERVFNLIKQQKPQHHTILLTHLKPKHIQQHLAGIKQQTKQ